KDDVKTHQDLHHKAHIKTQQHLPCKDTIKINISLFVLYMVKPLHYKDTVKTKVSLRKHTM
ncbi:hypothetical protein AB6G67_23925, partial [Enterobacter hormaechei]|uniref:hypothetical protein n=1 Tax=Enterobacter hormaechei TaxID=158836 RepID=UPI0034DD2384